VRVELEGGGGTLRYDIIDRFDPETGLSAMMRTTAFPASIVALMMARGRPRLEAPSAGALHPAGSLLEELAKRKIEVRITEG